MKIVIAHNTYQQAGGEDTVVASELELLRSHGHDVQLYFVSNDDIRSLTSKLRTAFSVSYSNTAKKKFSDYLRSRRPDLVHFHNIFPLLTSSVYDVCAELGIPVVQTLHNYRAFCAGGMFVRDGRICENCLNASPYQAVRHRCYRNSRLQSLAVANMIHSQQRRNIWHERIDRFITLTSFSRSKFVEAGFPVDKLSVKPNFITDPEPDLQHPREDFALYVGRISDEKGVDILCRSFESLNIPIKIAGDGPLRPALQSQATDHIEFLGSQNREQVFSLMQQAKVLILPSINYEGFPMVLVEAYAHGLPVICSRLGSMAEVVEDQYHGLHFIPEDSSDLASKVEWLFNHSDTAETMGQNVRQTYLNHYTPEHNYQQLMAIYQEAIDEQQTS